jgi:16S rRNA C967 or C1407 C5-methylase (RsmB/RsmF family)
MVGLLVMAKKAAGNPRKTTSDRAAEFSAYYDTMYPGRWPAIRDAMLGEGRYRALGPGLIREYYLDEASFFAGSYLEAEGHHRILDLCAAPGGKSLVILSNMMAGLGDDLSGLESLAGSIDFTANERSGSRRGRMKKVFADHLPPVLAPAIRVTGHDAARWGQVEPEAYDRIILDVPCSSERHVLQDEKYLDQWSPSRSTRLAQQAYSFALSALQALRPGGVLVYSTCALSVGENDGVIDRVLTRILKKGDMSVMTDNRNVMAGSPLPPWVENTSLGFAILPDRADGRGPMYISRMKKL